MHSAPKVLCGRNPIHCGESFVHSPESEFRVGDRHAHVGSVHKGCRQLLGMLKDFLSYSQFHYDFRGTGHPNVFYVFHFALIH